MSTLVKLFTPWYDHGRRFVGIKPGEADKLVAQGLTASYAEGTVTISDPAGQYGTKYYPVNKHLHRRHIIKWVDGFNERAHERVRKERA
jgi:hypothetical protein